ncbi:uncharacterized protein [Ptychodera flava]|uniref:uncharacterized protein n=1 Tax=Ptychodera flava TaxID=63121 RepID=UPI00396A6BED
MKAVWCFLCLVILHCGNERMVAWCNMTTPQLGAPPSPRESFHTSSVKITSHARSRRTLEPVSQEPTASFQTDSIYRTTRSGPQPRQEQLLPTMLIDPKSLQCRNSFTDRPIESCLSNGDINCIDETHVPAIATNMVMCSCKPECVIYGDCCHDYQSVCPNKSKEFENVADTRRCMESGSKYGGQIVTVRCPKNWPNDVIRAKCENSTGETMLEVTTAIKSDGNNSVVYRNIYCGFCHGVNPNDMQFGQLKWECPMSVRDVISDTETDSLSVISRLRAIPSCKLLPVIPGSLEDINLYCHYYIGTCPEGTNSTVVELCQNHTAKVIKDYVSLVYYKNVYCAMCNEEDFNPHNIVCGIPRDIRIHMKLWTFDILFNINVQGNYDMKIRRVSSTQQFSCADGEVFDVFTEKCTPLNLQRLLQTKLSTPQQYNVSDNIAVGALSESLLILRLEFTSPSKIVNTSKIETDAAMLVNNLYRNATKSLEILEFQMLPSPSNCRQVLLKYSVFVDSVTLAKVLRETCLDSWQEHVYYFLPQDVTTLDVSFKRRNLCNDSKEETVLNTTILFHKSETIPSSSLSNITKQSPNHLHQLKYRACHYEQVGDGIVSIKTTIGACLRHDSNISCAKGVIIKVGKENFKMLGEDIVYRSMHYSSQEYFLSEDGLHAFLCHFDKKRVFFWDLNTKTYSKRLLTFTTSVLSIGPWFEESAVMDEEQEVGDQSEAEEVEQSEDAEGLEEQLEELKQAKAKSKAAFTKLRHQLLRLLEEDEEED